MESWISNGLPGLTIAEIVLDKRSYCGGIKLDYLVVDSNIISLKNGSVKETANIEGLIKSGIKEIYHLPSLPTTFE